MFPNPPDESLTPKKEKNRPRSNKWWKKQKEEEVLVAEGTGDNVRPQWMGLEELQGVFCGSQKYANDDGHRLQLHPNGSSVSLIGRHDFSYRCP